MTLVSRVRPLARKSLVIAGLLISVVLIFLMIDTVPNEPTRVGRDDQDGTPPAPVTTSLQLIRHNESDHRKAIQATIEEVHPDFDLHFVEFDDQGWLWNRRALQKTLDCIEARSYPASGKSCETPHPPGLHTESRSEPQTAGATIVTFIHGWKHNSDVSDENLSCFRNVLQLLADQERDWARERTSRRVIGLYVGWRGLTHTREPWKEITFWARKEVAHSIGRSTDAAQLFTRLSALQQDLHAAERNTGFVHPRSRLTPAIREKLFQRLRAVETTQCPFANLPETKSGRWGFGLTAVKMSECRWLKPKLGGERETCC